MTDYLTDDTPRVETKCWLAGSIAFLREGGTQTSASHSSHTSNLWAFNFLMSLKKTYYWAKKCNHF